MKYIVLVLLLTIISFADEMQRMESIVADIEKLRKNYNICVKELASKSTDAIVPKGDDVESKLKLQKQAKLLEEYVILLDKEKMKNRELLKQNDALIKLSLQNNEEDKKSENSNKNVIKNSKIKENELKVDFNKKIEELKLKYEKIIKNKESIINSLKNKQDVKKKTKIAQNDICEDKNPFPKLLMKNSPKELVQTIQKSESVEEVKKITKATTYRLNKESDIFDNVNGEVLFSWENKTSFTSIEMTENWVRISGYFVDGKWTQAQEGLWVKKINTTQR